MEIDRHLLYTCRIEYYSDLYRGYITLEVVGDIEFGGRYVMFKGVDGVKHRVVCTDIRRITKVD